MPGDLESILDAAEQAAASNDFPAAARHLREAAMLQERELGPAHADLANTLNNLGVVCERIGEIDEAERSFRRAYAIATTAFPPDHPFVATSRENLKEFCRLHDRLFEEPAASIEEDAFVSEEHSAPAGSEDRAYTVGLEQDPAYVAGLEDPAYAAASEAAGATELDPTYERPEPERKSAPLPLMATRREASRVETPARGIPVGVIAVVGIAILIVIGWMAWPSGTISERSRAVIQDTTPPPVAAPTPEPPKPSEDPTSVASTPAPEPPKPAPNSTPADAAPIAPDSAAPPKGDSDVAVADARLCRNLTTSGAWQCDQVTGEVGPGTIYFFTRVAAARDTTVQHRWYFGDQLRQSVMLSIQANSAGYRTFSRTTIAPDRAGEWRVELRTEDGRMLREERFTVR
jgi:hypothetical protein